MAKSLRSKWKRKMRAVKRVRYGVKEKAMLEKMVSQSKKSEDVEMKTAQDIKDAQAIKSEFSSKSFKNKDGNYPKWMSKQKIKKIKDRKKIKKKK